MDFMTLYDKLRKVPESAQKRISAGRLKGMTDINPMWRIQSLTEQFGPVGFGWKYEIARQWEVSSPGTNEIMVFCNINLYVKADGEWSAAIPGTGGSTFVAKETSGLHASDECHKMALTDAISVACKALGMGADIYWAAGRSKYTQEPRETTPVQSTPDLICADCGQPITGGKVGGEYKTAEEVAGLTLRSFGRCLCGKCASKQ